MSTKWREQYFNKYKCEGVVSSNDEGDIVVRGKVKTNSPNAKIIYWAANPSDRGYSFSGSGLPYANPEQAYDNSPNVGVATTVNGEFKFNIHMPNSYYVGLGTIYIAPHVHIKVCEENGVGEYTTIKLDEGIPFRTLTYPAPPSKRMRVGPEFYYEPRLPIRSQEKILRDSGYPCKNKMPDNFWGLTPPN